MHKFILSLLIFLPNFVWAGNAFMEQDLNKIQAQNQQAAQSVIQTSQANNAKAKSMQQSYDNSRGQMLTIMQKSVAKNSAGSKAPQQQQATVQQPQQQQPIQYTTPKPEAQPQKNNTGVTGFSNNQKKQQGSGGGGWDYGL